jgi:superfamily II DNA or RNA helicase
MSYRQRYYQREALEAIKDNYEQGITSQLLVMATATGKTVVASAVPDTIGMRRGERLMFLVHRDELAFQAADKLSEMNPSRTVGMEKAQYRAGDADIVVASVQTIGRCKVEDTGEGDRWDYSPRLTQFNPDQFRVVVTDECFPAGTLVDGRPIESIKAREDVLSFGEDGRIERKPVVRIFKRPCRSLITIHLDNGSVITCTPNHPIHCPEYGFIPAGEIPLNAVVSCITTTQSVIVKHVSKTMRSVREVVHPEKLDHKNGPNVFSRVQTTKKNLPDSFHAGSMPTVWNCHNSTWICGDTSVQTNEESLLFRGVQEEVHEFALLRNYGQDQPEVRLGQDEGPEPDVEPCLPGESQDHSSGYGMEAAHSRRQRETNKRSPNALGFDFGMGHGGDRPYWSPEDEQPTPTHPLQAGHSESYLDGLHRSGRDEPQPPFEEGPRREKRSVFGTARVDRIEVHQQGRDDGFERLCPDGFVYNLEVEDNHTYFANGVAVHNCHHSLSKGYVSVYHWMRVMKGEDDRSSIRLNLGISATPNRSDNIGLERIYDKIVYEYGIRQGIDDKFLARIQAYRLETEVDLSKVHTLAGDFNPRELEDTVNNPYRNELIAQKWLELKPPGPSIFFSVDVAHSHDLAEVLQSHGAKIYPLSGKTPDEERKRLIASIKDRSIDGLVSAGVLNEGTDLPAAVAGFLCRPTKSGLLYRQQVGRLIRPHPAPEDIEDMQARGLQPPWVKDCAMIIDVVDLSSRHQLITVPTLFGLRDKFDGKGKDIIAQVEEIESMEEKYPTLDLRSQPNLDAVKTALHSLDLLKPPETPEEIRRLSRLLWLKEGDFAYHLGTMSGVILQVRGNQLGHWEIWTSKNGVRSKLWVSRSLQEAIAQAEQEVPDQEKRAMAAGASWRHEPPSEKQAGLLWYLLLQSDRTARSKWPRKEDLYAWCLSQYKAGNSSFSRGSISTKIDSLQQARN